MADFAAVLIPAPKMFGAFAEPTAGAGFFTVNIATGSNSPPVVSNFVPPLGNITRRQRLQFDLLDDSGLIGAWVLMVGYAGALPSEVVYYRTSLKEGYCGHYSGDTAPVPGGLRLSNLGRLGGWPSSPHFYSLAIDPGGAYG